MNQHRTRDGSSTDLKSIEWPMLLAHALANRSERHERLRQKSALRISPGTLHDFRIETRRQLALVALADAVLSTNSGKLRRALKRCLRDTSEVRDAEVQLDRVDKLIPQHPKLRKFRRRLRRRLKRRTRETEARLSRRKPKAFKGACRLAATLAQRGPRSNDAVVVLGALQRAINQTRNRALTANQSVEQLHRARVALKQMRYMVDVLHGIAPGIPAEWLEQLHVIQKAMGEVHDLEMLSNELVRYVQHHPKQRRRLRTARAAVSDLSRRLRERRDFSLLPMPDELQRLLAHGDDHLQPPQLMPVKRQRSRGSNTSVDIEAQQGRNSVRCRSDRSVRKQGDVQNPGLACAQSAVSAEENGEGFDR